MTSETFNSETQQSLFREGNTDDFMSGLSRAFTLANPKHNVGRRRPMHAGMANETAVAFFATDLDDGEVYEVHVVRVDNNR